jgi:hypothetical protein
MKERDFQMYLNFEQQRVKDRFFKQMQPEIVQALSSDQKRDITRALIRAFLYPSPRILDIRWVFSLFQERFFLLFLFGRDSRDGDPRYFNRFLSRSRWVANTLFLILVVWTLFCSMLGMGQVLKWITA